jgi:hypothetical protein
MVANEQLGVRFRQCRSHLIPISLLHDGFRALVTCQASRTGYLSLSTVERFSIDLQRQLYVNEDELG